MQTLTNSVSSDVTNSTPEPTKPVKSAKQIAAAEALRAMSSLLAPERGMKAKAHRESVDTNKKEKLGQKLALLTAGNFEHKGKRKSLNVRATLIEMVKAARLGATAEQLTLTGVGKRFAWANIEAPVRAYATAAGEHATLVLQVLYPAAAAEALIATGNAAPVVHEPASKSEAKAALPKTAAKPAQKGAVQPTKNVRKAG